MSEQARNTVLQTLAFHEAWSYAPSRPELFATMETTETMSRGDAEEVVQQLLGEGVITERRGRFGFPQSIDGIVREIDARDILQPRKRRRAIRVARFLSRLGGVRFVALANTTALGAARDFGDLDFFVVVRRGSIWTTRLLAALPIKVLGLQPRGDEVRDAVCFSYFISDDSLDLSSHMLAGDDPYFRYWFLSLLPLLDDGISEALWAANGTIRRNHPLAEKWIPPQDLLVNVPRLRLPVLSALESIAKRLQLPRLPAPVRELMNRDTRVIVNDRTLKFHVMDGREAFRAAYRTRCSELGLAI